MRHKKLFANLLFAAVILLAAGALFLLRGAGRDRDAPLQARLIYGDGNASLDLPLDADGVYDVDTGYLTVHVEIRDGAARFIDSPCPDHVCEGVRLADPGGPDRHLPARPGGADPSCRRRNKGSYPMDFEFEPEEKKTPSGRGRSAPSPQDTAQRRHPRQRAGAGGQRGLFPACPPGPARAPCPARPLRRPAHPYLPEAFLC